MEHNQTIQVRGGKAQNSKAEAGSRYSIYFDFRRD
jgi:hypothetical protein